MLLKEGVMRVLMRRSGIAVETVVGVFVEKAFLALAMVEACCLTVVVLPRMKEEGEEF